MSSSSTSPHQPSNSGGTSAAAAPSTSNSRSKDPDASALSELLAALAAGVRAVQGIPTEDEFSFQSSFPEFSEPLSVAQTSLLETLSLTLESLPDQHDEHAGLDFVDVDDSLLWDRCADACDALLDQVESLQSEGGTTTPDEVTLISLQRWSNQARYRSHKFYGRMLEGLVEMEKPQITFHISLPTSRTEPFIPRVHPKKPFALQNGSHFKPCLVSGHGLETRNGDLRSSAVQVPQNIVAPAQHALHYYQPEIEALEYTEWQLEACDSNSIKKPVLSDATTSDELTATWVDTVEELEQLRIALDDGDIREIAFDLEAHSYHSFTTLVCLAQLSFRDTKTNSEETFSMRNYLIDTLALHSHLNAALQPVLANPAVVKVMHGADHDIPWFQSNFGLYVVNLFDAGRAARALKFPSASYAYLLQHYVGVVANKSHQLADWRQRPLPSLMQQYAIQDTHYLLYIYDCVKWDLYQMDPSLIRNVLDVSRQVSLIRYAVEPFNPDGYKVLLSRRGTRRRSELNALQERVLKSLWEWRDRAARESDESVTYICDNKALTRLALSSRNAVSLRALQALFNPLPPGVTEHAQEVIDLIKQERRVHEEHEEEGSDELEGAQSESAATNADGESFTLRNQQQASGTAALAFIKTTGTEAETVRSGMSSPVLATDALFEQARWVFPEHEARKNVDEEVLLVDVHTSTGTDDDDGDQDEKPKRMLSVHDSNKGFRSKQPSGHSIGLGGVESGREGFSDGMGTVLAARECSQSPVLRSVEDEARESERSSARIRAKLERNPLPGVLNLITPTRDMEDDEDVAQGETELKPRDGGEGETDEEDYAIPRSMKEIYKISNRNRRNKKTGSPTPERGVTPTCEKEREELAKAEALLRDRGAMYLEDDSASPGKKPRTKPASGRDSEESIPHDVPAEGTNREEDLALIKDLGWIKDDHESFASGAVPCDFDYGIVGATGVDPSQLSSVNPFFSGSALSGGPLSQGFAKSDQRQKKSTPSKGTKQSTRRTERPEKKDGRTYSYKKR